MEQLNCLVWDIDYSLAPENPFPFAAEEAYEIVSYAFEHSTELGIDQEKIILAGHSAGGNLVASVLIKRSSRKIVRRTEERSILGKTCGDRKNVH